jgi:hypothetical protein
MTTPMTTTLTSQQAKINEFLRLFKEGGDIYVRAGELLVEMVEEDPYIYDYIISQCPTLNAAVLGRLEQMGRKTLHPQLLFTNSPGFSKLLKLPYSMQERYVTEPVPMIVHTEAGTDVLLVKAKDMTKEQAAQVFAPGRVRTEGEQKAWLVQQRSEKAIRNEETVKTPWKIRGHKVIINGVEFTRKEIAGILAQME